MRLPEGIRKRYRAWLGRRIPAASSVTLDQRRIFILPTGYGLLFLLIAAALFIAGINYENNLLLTFSFFLASLFNVAIWHTFRNLSGLTLQAGGMREGFAGQNGALEIRLVGHPGRGHTGIWLNWLEVPKREASVAAADQYSIWLDIPLRHRGKVAASRVRVETHYPLGLLRAWSLVDLAHHCLAWPRPVASVECPARGAGDEQGEQVVRAGNEDFEGLRNYVEGDSMRMIHWKSLARERGLNTKVFADPAEGRQWLDWERMPGLDPESRLSRLCYWVLELDKTSTPYGISLPGEELSPGLGPEHRLRALRMLALYGGG